MLVSRLHNLGGQIVNGFLCSCQSLFVVAQLLLKFGNATLRPLQRERVLFDSIGLVAVELLTSQPVKDARLQRLVGLANELLKPTLRAPCLVACLTQQPLRVVSLDLDLPP